MKKFYTKELGSVQNAELFWNQISEQVKEINGKVPSISPFFSFGKYNKGGFGSVKLSFLASNEKETSGIDTIQLITKLEEQSISFFKLD